MSTLLVSTISGAGSTPVNFPNGATSNGLALVTMEELINEVEVFYAGVVNVFNADGIDPTGVVECAAQIQALMAGAKFVNFGAGTFKIATALVPETGQTLMSSGATIRTSGATTSAFYCNEINNFSFIGKLNIIGTVTGTPAYSVSGGNGIIVRDCYNWTISNVSASWLAGTGIFVTVSTDSLQVGPGVSLGSVSSCYTMYNGYGVRLSGGFMAEYVSFNGCFSEYNAESGVQDYAGNIMWIGGSVSRNYKNGFELRNSFNSAHGVVSGCTINHNIEKAIWALDISAGHTFNGCPIFDNNAGGGVGGIHFVESTGISLVACQLYADVVVTNAAKDKINVLTACSWVSGGGAPGRQFQVLSGDASEFTVYVDPSCFQAGTLGDGVPNRGLSISDAQMTATIDQVLTAGVETQITWNAFVNRHGFNMHDDTLKNFKIKVPGVYRINPYLVLSSPGTMPAAQIYAVIKVTGVGKRYQTVVPHNTTDAWGNFTVTMQLEKDDVVDVYVFVPSGTVSLKADSSISISIG